MGWREDRLRRGTKMVRGGFVIFYRSVRDGANRQDTGSLDAWFLAYQMGFSLRRATTWTSMSRRRSRDTGGSDR